jgi:hypothetical protein
MTPGEIEKCGLNSDICSRFSLTRGWSAGTALRGGEPPSLHDDKATYWILNLCEKCNKEREHVRGPVSVARQALGRKNINNV